MQICQFIVTGWNQTSLLHGHFISIYITDLTYDLFSRKMQVSHINLKIV